MRQPWRKRRARLAAIESQADDLLSAAHSEAAKTRDEARDVARLRRDTVRLERHNQIADIIRSGLGRSGA